MAFIIIIIIFETTLAIWLLSQLQLLQIVLQSCIESQISVV